MTPLNTDLRSRLEAAVRDARTEAERGARQAVDALAVDRREPHRSMSPAEQALRRRLRAHGRQVGDTRDPGGTQTLHRLVREIAYEQWHRMLFARFLAENHLLIEPESGVAITLEECAELARERHEDPWALAASFAQGMLPRIFRSGDPALEVTLPPETRQRLQGLLAGLPRGVFLQEDSLGWTYQFWQSAEKDAVNERVRSGEKITGGTLPAVTQLFTEPYMVHFLLHNTIGAWHAGRTLSPRLRETAASEGELREAARLLAAGGYDLKYLRFVREPRAEDPGEKEAPRWRPAAGTYPGWPKSVRELRVLDPCCGSGHFLVAALELLVRLHMEEGLDLRGAVRAVLSENLFGLELDPRCTQIAAFNLAFAAWRLVGEPMELPPLRIACSGIGPQATKREWLELAAEAAAGGGIPGDRDHFGAEDTLLSAGVSHGLEALYDIFEQAPELGSLIDLKGASQLDALQADFTALEPLLDTILQREGLGEEEVERAVAAKGMAEAVRILAGPKDGYTLVATNVPYLGIRRHDSMLLDYLADRHPDARHDLATAFHARIRRFLSREGGTAACVLPHSWLFSGSYKSHRVSLLGDTSWQLIVALGSGAFEMIGGEVVKVVLQIASETLPKGKGLMSVLDLTSVTSAGEKAMDLVREPLRFLHQSQQLRNPDARVLLSELPDLPLLETHAECLAGIQNGDSPRYLRNFWEMAESGARWALIQTSVDLTTHHGGFTTLIDFDLEEGHLRAPASWRREALHDSDQRGRPVWGRRGVLVSRMSQLPVTLYEGYPYDQGSAAIVPEDASDLPGVWAFCQSDRFTGLVRQIDSKLNVTSATLAKVPFDLPHWQKVAHERYPNGLPEPYSDDPTQWLFHGHPAHAERGTELHVAVARLLGYQWPAELDPEMRLAPEARALIERCRELDAQGLADADGIVPLVPVRGESSAADRLRALLAAAYGPEWSGAKERELLAVTAAAAHGNGRRADTLEEWLQGSFFEEHSKLFHHRPFLWHLWDGLRDGFNVLVNYHRLAGPGGQGRRTLEALTFAYLGEWIERQRSAREAGREGADARLAAALHLQDQLQKILDGEPPYDLFVRWKPLHEQPLGWEPDINDGARLNIRPFLRASDVGRKDAGILRWRPNVKWGKDRGKEPESLRPRGAFPWFWGCDPEKNPGHGTDFGCGLPGAVPAGSDFTGVRWNELHYTRRAKEAARARAGGREAKP